MIVDVDGKTYDVEIKGTKVLINGNESVINIEEDEEGIRSVTIDGEKFFVDYFQPGQISLIIVNGSFFQVSHSTESMPVREILAPISGQVLEVAVVNGSEVAKGQLLVTLEAMKMENQIKSPVKGKVKEVRVRAGQSVKDGETLVTFG